MKSIVFTVSLAFSSALVHAQEALDPPPLPAPLQSGEALETEVTIVQRDDKTVYEYRVNGQMYMVKVVPKRGPAYYFLDQDGDGQLDAQRYGPGDISIPQWVLFRW